MIQGNISKKRKPAVKFFLTAAAVLSAVLVCLIIYSWYSGDYLADWQNKIAEVDMNGDGLLEELRTEDRVFSVCRSAGSFAAPSQESVLWQTDSRWLVEDFLYGDIDRDGEQEMLLLVWKRGSYGDYRPFWIEKDDSSFSQHIFIYKWTDNDKSDAVWMSSELSPGVGRWSINGNGTINIHTADGEDTVWFWHTWGLERLQ